jgi:hypothetical protein
MTDHLAAERADILERFSRALSRASGDGSVKRAGGTKPPWYFVSHEAQVFSHIAKWKRGERVDPDSGVHPLVHAAWRCLALACLETGDVPEFAKGGTRGEVVEASAGGSDRGMGEVDPGTGEELPHLRSW